MRRSRIHPKGRNFQAINAAVEMAMMVVSAVFSHRLSKGTAYISSLEERSLNARAEGDKGAPPKQRLIFSTIFWYTIL